MIRVYALLLVFLLTSTPVPSAGTNATTSTTTVAPTTTTGYENATDDNTTATNTTATNATTTNATAANATAANATAANATATTAGPSNPSAAVSSYKLFVHGPLNGLSNNGGDLLRVNMSGNVPFFAQNDTNRANASAIYGPVGNVSAYRTRRCTVVSNAEILCMAVGSRPGLNRNDLRVRIEVTTTNNTTTFLTNDTVAYRAPFLTTVHGGSIGLPTMGGAVVTIQGGEFGLGGSSDASVNVLYGPPGHHNLYEATNATVLNDTYIVCRTVALFPGSNRTKISWRVRVEDQTSIPFLPHTATAIFEPPLITAVLGPELNTSGNDRLTVRGKSFGPTGNNTVLLSYGLLNFSGTGCVVIADNEIHCTTGPGAGADLRWRVRLQDQPSALSGPFLSYRRPTVQSVEFSDGALPTNGSARVLIRGQDFGAFASSHVSVTMHVRSGLVVEGVGCASNHDTLNCSSTTPGSGRVVIATVIVLGQESNFQLFLDFAAPVVSAVEGYQSLPSRSAQTIALVGENFGAVGTYTKVSYRWLGHAGEQRATGCRVTHAHRGITCLSSVEAHHGDLDLSTIAWTVHSDGISSEPFPTHSASKETVYNESLLLGLRTIDALSDTLYILGKQLNALGRAKLFVYTRGDFSTPESVVSDVPSGISTLEFWPAGNSLVATMTTLSGLHLTRFNSDFSVNGTTPIPSCGSGCRIKYGVSALDPLNDTYYFATRSQYDGDAIVQVDLGSPHAVATAYTAHRGLEISQLSCVHDDEFRLEIHYRRHSYNISSAWQHAHVRGNALYPLSGNNRTQRRNDLLASPPFHSKKMYLAAAALLPPETVPMGNGEKPLTLHDMGVQEYTYAVPVMAGPSMFDVHEGYSMVLSSAMLRIKEPTVSFEFPDSKTGWESFRIVMVCDVEVRVYLKVVQVVDLNATLLYPNASQMITGDFTRQPKQAGKAVAHRHYVVDIRKPWTPVVVVAGGAEILPDTSAYDIFYLARHGSYRMSATRRVQSATVSQPPKTKDGFPLVTGVTVSSFVYNVRFSDRRGTVFYIVTEENNLCDETALDADVPGTDFKDKLTACVANTPGTFQSGEFQVSQRETPVDGDENRGEFSGSIEIKGLPPYKSYVVYSTGISFGLTAQFEYEKTLVNLVGFAASAGTDVIHEGNQTRVPIFVKLSKQPHKDEVVQFSCVMHDTTLNARYTELPQNAMEGLNFNSWQSKMLVGHVVGERDMDNSEAALKAFRITCTNEANVGDGFIYTYSLSIVHDMLSRNVIWPEWNRADVLVAARQYTLPEPHNSMTTSGDDVVVLSQTSASWIGRVFEPGILATVAGVNCSAAMQTNGRALTITLPPYESICASKDCAGPKGYQTLTLRNPTPDQVNESAGGVASTHFLYYFEACTDTAFETDQSKCHEAAGVDSACAWGAGDACVPCLANAVCPGGPRAWPVEGFWSAGEFETDVFRCRTPSNERCYGYNISSHRSECKEGYEGGTPFCDLCDVGYYESIDGRCNRCETKRDWWTAVLLPLLNGFGMLLTMFVLVTNFVYLSTVLTGGTVTSATEMTLRLVFESALAIQIIAIAGMPVNANYLPFLKSIFDGLYLTLFDFRGQVYPQCLAGHVYEPFAFETAGMFAVLVAYSAFGILTVERVYKAVRSLRCIQRLPIKNPLEHARNGLLTFLQVSYGAVAVNAFDLVHCTTKLGEYRLARRPSFVCYEGHHTGVALLSIVLIVAFTFGFPLISYWKVRTALAGEKEHRAPSLMMFSFWTRSDLKKKYYWFREVRQIVVTLLAMNTAFFTDNNSRSGAFGINLFILVGYGALLLYVKPYTKRGGWVMSTMVTACVVAFVANVLSYMAILTYDYKAIKVTEAMNSVEWVMIFSSIGFLGLAWWRFQAHILAFRKSMSVEVKVKSRPQHRWEHHVRGRMRGLGETNSTKVVPSPAAKGKVNKISPASVVGKKGRAPRGKGSKKHAKPSVHKSSKGASIQVVPQSLVAHRSSRSNSKSSRRNVTKVVPTRYGNIVRVNIAENDGHQLSDSWCFSTTTIHQLSVFKKNMNWWYSLQFLLQVVFVLLLRGIPLPSSAEGVREALRSGGGAASNSTSTSTSSVLELDAAADYVETSKAVLAEVAQLLLMGKGAACAVSYFAAITLKRQSCCRFWGSRFVFGTMFFLATCVSLYGLTLVKDSVVLRSLAAAVEGVALACMFASVWQHRRLRKIAAKVRPGGLKNKPPPRATHQQKKKNKMVENKKGGEKGGLARKASLLRYMSNAVIPLRNVHGDSVLEEHFHDHSAQYNDRTGTTRCILLLKPAARAAKEREMMRHEEERQNMIFEDRWALRCRDEPKRMAELEHVRREDERQQMFEWEIEQRRIEEEIRRRAEIKIMRRAEAQARAFAEDARSRRDNRLYDQWLAVERRKQATELDAMRQVEATQRMMSEELREYWIQICQNHLEDMAQEGELQSLYQMRREEERQRMFETEVRQRRDADQSAMNRELPLMRREEVRQRMLDEEVYTRRYYEEHQALASQMSAIRVLEEKLASGDLDQIKAEIAKIHKVFAVEGMLAALVERCEAYVTKMTSEIKLDLIDAMNDFDNPHHLDRLEVALSKAWHALHPAEAKLLERASKIEKELEHLRDIRAKVDTLSQTTIAEIKSFKTPNEMVVAVIVSLFILLGHEPEELDTWQKCVALMGKTGERSVKRRILAHQLSSLRKARVKLVKKLIKPVDVSKIQSISSGAAVLFGWVLGVLSEYKIRGTGSRAQSRMSLLSVSAATSTFKTPGKKKRRKSSKKKLDGVGEAESVEEMDEDEVTPKRKSGKKSGKKKGGGKKNTGKKKRRKKK